MLDKRIVKSAIKLITKCIKKLSLFYIKIFLESSSLDLNVNGLDKCFFAHFKDNKVKIFSINWNLTNKSAMVFILP